MTFINFALASARGRLYMLNLAVMRFTYTSMGLSTRFVAFKSTVITFVHFDASL